MARRAGPAVRHHTQRHAGVRDARRRAFHLRPGDILLAEDTTGTGHSWKLVDENPWRRGLCDPLPRRPGAVRRQLAQFTARLIKREALYDPDANPGALDVVLIGAGIMSATLATCSRSSSPRSASYHVRDVEDCAQESSQPGTMPGPATRPIVS